VPAYRTFRLAWKQPQVLVADLNRSEPGLRTGGIQVMPMKSAFLERVPAQKEASGRSWAGSPGVFDFVNHPEPTKHRALKCIR
jgi:hypothetical protein